jgi:riboflavin kinase/FMN adenylyltransferase
MLGRPYALCGQVQIGDRLGRQLGFPTANLDPTGLLLPPFGVYAVNALLGTQRVPGVLNIGVRPTVKNAAGGLRVEVHLLDFAADLYGQELELELVKHLREERKFPSLDKLREQITADISAARATLASGSKPA